MTIARIAVEVPFDDVKRALEEKGHEVQMFTTDEDVTGFDLGVVRAINEGNNDEFNFPVVSMKGMSINDVVDTVENRINQLS